MQNFETPQITLADYALTPMQFFASGAQSVGEYIKQIGADNLLVMPSRTRITRDILSNGRETAVGVVRQTYRGERKFQEVRDWLQAEGLSRSQQRAKFLIALKTFIAMPHKDDSLEDVEHIASQRRSADIMYEITARAIQSARRVAAWDAPPRRIVQLTTDNLELLIGQTEPTYHNIQAALSDNGFTHFSYHSDSTPQVFASNHEARVQALAPAILQYELTAFRADLINGTRDDPDVSRLIRGEYSRTAHTIQELRHYGAPLQRVVYAIPGNHLRNLADRQAIVAQLRQI